MLFHLLRSSRLILVSTLLVLGAFSATANAQGSAIRIGTPPWPGAKVKAQVVKQLLGAIGYDATVQPLGTEILILRGLSMGDVDLYLSLWLPLSQGNVESFLKEGTVTKVAINMQGAVMGLAVPEYVHAAGVDSIGDLHKFAKRFHKKIYGIETGNYWNLQAKKLIRAGKFGLGDWQVIPSSTAAMLTQVDRATRRGEWIVFYGWRPHWMNLAYDLYYLKGPADSVVAHVESTVWTISRSGFLEKHGQVARFLRQFHVSTHTQSKWILEYGKNQRPAAKVARSWIQSHPGKVRAWLDGIKASNGQPAIEAVTKKFGY